MENKIKNTSIITTLCGIITILLTESLLQYAYIHMHLCDSGSYCYPHFNSKTDAHQQLPKVICPVGSSHIATGVYKLMQIQSREEKTAPDSHQFPRLLPRNLGLNVYGVPSLLNRHST